MRTISIAEVSFFDAFGIDADFHDLYPQAAYLDIEAGDVIWIFEEDQDVEMAEEFLHEHCIKPLWR